MVSSDEQWRDISGYEGCYQISDKGRVKSLSRPVIRGDIHGVLKERILAPRMKGDKTKYPSVLLSKGGEKCSKKIHHLVLEAFVGEKPFPDAVARHLNDNPMDNSVENLVWGTTSENTVDKFRNGYASTLRLLNQDQIIAISEDERSQRVIAKEYGVSQTTIWKIKKGGVSHYSNFV